jgi:hypothetical protein
MRANGKEKIAINLAEMGATPSVPVAQRAGICILEGGHLAVSLETLESAALMEAMTTRLDPGFDVFAETIGDCIRLLARHGGWRLRLSDDPEAALPSLAAMFDVLTGG